MPGEKKQDFAFRVHESINLPPPVDSASSPHARAYPSSAAAVIASMIVAEAITIIKGLHFTLEEINHRLMTKTDKHNKRLSNSLKAFLARVDGECIEGRVPSETWRCKLEKLSGDINKHVTACDRHAAAAGALAFVTSISDNISDNARAKQLRKDVDQLKSSMDFIATPASTPTSS